MLLPSKEPRPGTEFVVGLWRLCLNNKQKHKGLSQNFYPGNVPIDTKKHIIMHVGGGGGREGWGAYVYVGECFLCLNFSNFRT